MIWDVTPCNLKDCAKYLRDLWSATSRYVSPKIW